MKPSEFKQLLKDVEACYDSQYYVANRLTRGKMTVEKFLESELRAARKHVKDYDLENERDAFYLIGDAQEHLDWIVWPSDQLTDYGVKTYGELLEGLTPKKLIKQLKDIKKELGN